MSENDTIDILTLENRQLRAMLAGLYSGPHLITGDGGLRDECATPSIDFCDDDPMTILNKMKLRAGNELHRSTVRLQKIAEELK